MTTGTIMNNGSGPQGPNNAASSGTDNNMPGSGILSGIIQGTQTYNAATLEFDFIPYADTVRFKYVFGSEEYPEFAPPNNSTYNDVFGFFMAHLDSRSRIKELHRHRSSHNIGCTNNDAVFASQIALDRV